MRTFIESWQKPGWKLGLALLLVLVLGSLYACPNIFGDYNNPLDPFAEGIDPPSTPSDFRVSKTTKDSIALAWSPSSLARGYHVYRSDTEGGTYLALDGDLVQTLEYLDSGLADGRTCWYKLEAWNAAGTSPLSVPVQASTLKLWHVSYDGNDQTGGTVPVDSAGYLTGDQVTLALNSGPDPLVCTGFTFTGWTIGADGPTAYPGGTVIPMGSADLVLFAAWTQDPTWQVIYKGNGNTGGSVPVDNHRYLPNQTATILGNTGSLEKTGYVFADWNTDPAGNGTAWNSGSACQMGSANLILYAVWKPVAATPSMDVIGGNFPAPLIVTLTCTSPNATIFYTTDGSDPRVSGTAKDGSTVAVTRDMTINAYAKAPGYENSAVRTSQPFDLSQGWIFVSSSNGVDSNQGTAMYPLATIAKALATAANLFSSGEIRVAGGTYPITADINMVNAFSLSGSWSSDFSTRSLSANTTLLRDDRTSGNCAVISASSIDSTTFIDGFTIQAAATDGYSTGIGAAASFMVIRNNTIICGTTTGTNMYVFGLTASSGSAWTAYNNVIYGGNAAGSGSREWTVFLSNSSPSLYNNTILSGQSPSAHWVICLRADGGGCYPTLKNNLMVDLNADSGGEAGIYHMNSGSSNYPQCYTTNLFYLNSAGSPTLVYMGGTNPYNITTANASTQVAYLYSGTARILTYADPEWNNLVNLDPLFADAANGNWHLSASSPARAAGTDLTGTIPATDRDGNPRTAPWSIGAWEKD